MTERELKKLNRMELLEMLLTVSRENESLIQERDALRAELEERRLVMEKAGSIADAAMALSGVFEAAQAAADLYLASVRAKVSSESAPEGEKSSVC